MSAASPSNPSEWQLYRVLQRANLVQYYDTFVAQGGDDVHQLCEAGEEEFLEIMALVGMASKPLHVRRLQKALQEWVANPASFDGTGQLRPTPTQVSSLTTDVSPAATSPWSTPQKSVSPVMMPLTQSLESDMFTTSDIKIKQEAGAVSPGLTEAQVAALANSATRLAKILPHFEPKHLSQKKEINKHIQEIMMTPPEVSEDRLHIMRTYAAIYRRFDTERVYTKPMSMHEICVNEAAAQLCLHIPNLLSRREDLFPLARQVVKESGYQYSKGHSRSSDFNPENPSKKQKLDQWVSDSRSDSPQTTASGARELFQERLTQISKLLAKISQRQEQIVNDLDLAKEGQDLEKVDTLQSELELVTNQHLQLLTEQSELLRKQSLEVYNELEMSDREDSNMGASGSSSPTQFDNGLSTSSHALLKNILSSAQIPKSSLTSLSLLAGCSLTPSGLKNSLFDEGLRIAQQYGLGDFAQELKSLQGGSDVEDQKSPMPGDNSPGQNGSNGTYEEGDESSRDHHGNGEDEDAENADNGSL
ncbi:NGFI-A-binding protein 1-like isoform X1 [Dreissena polymorpha]|uniref:NGFI-A-binding protein 1-like isoform X1 n=1 Tax=Dreissena polymorpha TaxID=45954 RepID=UPI002264DD34|nr:NGFI-A-binding protein 1-like isoform X1 [Dreissena polymorpha]XP_052253638.1 NGFI-A-binding protein 1-like isoform X1 [Dreissena polymorpha]